MVDLSTNLPKQEGKCISDKKYSCFGYSIQGSSHITTEMPCQDYNNFEYLDDCGILIACIADGVGSCPLSHWGAYVAVENALKFVKEKLRQISNGNVICLSEYRNVIPDLLKKAFLSSQDAVEDFADENARPVAAFFSTLTLALYDGQYLCCEHVGDDGVVAQFQNGSVEMVTERVKGEEASSVYPLQSGSGVWKYSEAGLDERGPVVAFTMVTDGILDKFVFEDEIFKQTKGCCSGVYYPFMAPMVYGSPRAGLKADNSYDKMQYYLQSMNSENYRKQITDDLTLVSVVNMDLIRESKRPEFDAGSFQAASKYLISRQREGLYGTAYNVNNEKQDVSLQSVQEVDDDELDTEKEVLPDSKELQTIAIHRGESDFDDHSGDLADEAKEFKSDSQNPDLQVIDHTEETEQPDYPNEESSNHQDSSKKHNRRRKKSSRKFTRRNKKILIAFIAAILIAMVVGAALACLFLRSIDKSQSTKQQKEITSSTSVEEQSEEVEEEETSPENKLPDVEIDSEGVPSKNEDPEKVEEEDTSQDTSQDATDEDKDNETSSSSQESDTKSGEKDATK